MARDERAKLVNLTGHELFLTNNLDFTVLKSAGRARVSSEQKTVGGVDVGSGLVIPVLSIVEQEIIGLPDARKGVIYVVSGIVASFANQLGRMDVMAPSRTERNNGNGRVTSARALARIERIVDSES